MLKLCNILRVDDLLQYKISSELPRSKASSAFSVLTGAFVCVPFPSGFKKGLLNATDYTELDVVAESIGRVVTGVKSFVNRGTGPVVLKVVPVTSAAIFQVTIDQSI